MRELRPALQFKRLMLQRKPLNFVLNKYLQTKRRGCCARAVLFMWTSVRAYCKTSDNVHNAYLFGSNLR